MKIKTKLHLLSLTFIILLVVITTIIFYSTGQLEKELEGEDSADKLIKDISDFYLITNQYLLYHEKRMKTQWSLKYYSLGKQLTKMEDEFPDFRESFLLYKLVRTNLKSIEPLFLDLQAIVAKRKRLIQENQPEVNINRILTLEEMIQDEIMMGLRLLVSNAFELSEIFSERIVKVQQRANTLILFAIIASVILSSGISFIIIKAITGPINKLVIGAEIIGKGDLEHIVDVKTKDEIGKLAVGFNLMTGKRKMAEETLLQMHDELEKRTVELENNVIEVRQLNRAMVNLSEDLQISNQNLEIKTRQLATANQELESFSYSVSHDLRAPLRAIDGFSQMLVEDHGNKLDAEGQRQLNVIQSSTREMGQLIDDLLTFSRSSRKEIRMSDINMGELVEEVFKKLQLDTSGRQAQLNVGKLPPAKGDPAMVREVLVNLLSNAIKFTEPKETATIEITGTVENNETVYSVKDNGVGFDMKYIDKIFQVFQRLHSKEEFEGTGIGLALVKRIIDRHGGRAWAEGKVNKGATLFFTLPKKKGKEDA